jgi:hypothetical protein
LQEEIMRIRHRVSAVLIAALLGGIVPANAWAAGAELAKAKDASASGLQAAISRAATEATADSALRLSAPRAASQPVGRRKSGARLQSTGGGGHTGMIIGLVTTAVGIAATVYAVKAVQKETKTVQQPQ